jgi:hypothetical protein
MTYALSKFVSIPSVSSDPSHREDCRQAAIWLKKGLNQLGAQSALVNLLGFSVSLAHVQHLSYLHMKPEVPSSWGLSMELKENIQSQESYFMGTTTVSQDLSPLMI